MTRLKKDLVDFLDHFLPDNIDIKNIDVSCNSGVLEVVIPKLKDISNQKIIPIR